MSEEQAKNESGDGDKNPSPSTQMVPQYGSVKTHSEQDDASNQSERFTKAFEESARATKKVAEATEGIDESNQKIAEASIKSADAAIASAKANRQMVLVSALMLTVTAVQCIYTHYSLKQSSAALNASIDASRLDQRAWVTVTSIHIMDGFSNAKNSKVEAIVTNTGRTPALGWRIKCGTIYTGGEQSRSDIAKILKESARPLDTSVGVIGPDVHPIVTMDTDASTYPEFKRVLGVKPFYLYVFGRMDYRDIFGKDHFTTFCFYRVSDTPVSEIGFSVAPFGNETDESEKPDTDKATAKTPITSP